MAHGCSLLERLLGRKKVSDMLDWHYDEVLIVEPVPDKLTDDIQENFQKAMSLFKMIDTLPYENN